MADPRSSSGDAGGVDDADREAPPEERSGPDPDGATAGQDADERQGDGGESGGRGGAGGAESGADGEDPTEAELRRRVEEQYDFDDFGPRDMQEMSADEWEVAFDSETWITGDELLDRVEADLRSQVADREVFAVVENVHEDGDRRLLAYSDEGYAVVYPDGGVAGFGTVLRDVKPTVALCSMEEYDPGEAPDDDQLLPPPEAVPEGSGGLGHLMMQVIAGALILSGVVLLGAWLLEGLPVVVPAAGFFFLLGGLVLFAMVANARLSDRFRAAEYRERLRTVGVESGEYPEFVPVEDGRLVGLAADEGGTPDGSDGSAPEA